MKMRFNVENKNQPDPFIFEDKGNFYLYVTGVNGVEAYAGDDLFGLWEYKGIITDFKEGKEFWAPSVIKYDDKYYLYVSCEKEDGIQSMHVAVADDPLGPFTNEKRLYDCFSIDSHVVQTQAGLFLLLAMNRYDGERAGTRIYVDKLLDPWTPANAPVEKITPTFDEEFFTPQCTPERKWHTVEGPFWFEEDGWQYVMYSGGCYMDDTYHIGYAAARSAEADLTKVEFIKHTDGGKFDPVLIKNDVEEGTGHHSVIRHKGQYYAIYHGRDNLGRVADEYKEKRTARICRLQVSDGKITAERI